MALARIAWLTLGHALVIALAWGLVNVPDSNAWMIALSIATVAMIILVFSVVNATAAEWLLPGRSWREAFEASASSVPVVVAAAALVTLFWWVGDASRTWVAAHRGEIDAWLIANFDITKTAWLDRVGAVLIFLWVGVVGVSLAVALLYTRLERGTGAVLRFEWLRAGLSRDQLMLTAVAMTLLIALPWEGMAWRPRGLPPTWWQPAFAAVKIGLIFIVMNIGWLVVLLAGARNTASADST